MTHLNVLDAIEFLYLPLLTQEAAVMISAFTYGLRDGVSPWLLAGINASAIATDVAIFFVPTYLFSGRQLTRLSPRLHHAHARAVATADRFGAFRAALAGAFIMPSVSAMIVFGLMRLSFRRTLAGLVVGSGAYTLIPLLVAARVQSIVPTELIPILPWIAPALAFVVILVALLRSRRAR